MKLGISRGVLFRKAVESIAMRFTLLVLGILVGSPWAGRAVAQVAEGPPPLPKLERPFLPPSSGVPNTPAPAPVFPAQQPGEEEKPKSTVAARVVARVNGHPILLEELVNASALELEAVRPQVPDHQWPPVREEFLQKKLDDMITMEVVLQDAAARVQAKVLQQVKEAGAKDFDKKLKLFRERMKLLTEDDTNKFFISRGYSPEEMRSQYARQMVALEYLRNIVKDQMDTIDRQEMLEYYRANPSEFQRNELITWQHLYLDATRFATRQDALRQAQELHPVIISMQKKENFGPLAQQYSHSPDRYQNGENQDPPAQIRPPEVQEVLLKMVPGQTSGIIETTGGYHIVKMVAWQRGGQIPFQEACQDIRMKLMSKRWTEEYEKITKRLRAKATIENGQKGG